uniref:Uncharacterized protein n=1 Tax=Lepeophtheirus salmonis TaxID=72036 RepID=A0A0K2TZU2_LEPSM
MREKDNDSTTLTPSTKTTSSSTSSTEASSSTTKAPTATSTTTESTSSSSAATTESAPSSSSKAPSPTSAGSSTTTSATTTSTPLVSSGKEPHEWEQLGRINVEHLILIKRLGFYCVREFNRHEVFHRITENFVNLSNCLLVF